MMYSRKVLIIATALAAGSRSVLARRSFPSDKPCMARDSRRGHSFAKNPSLSLVLSPIRGGSDGIPAATDNNVAAAPPAAAEATAPISPTPVEDTPPAVVAVEEAPQAAVVETVKPKHQVVVNAKWANFMTRVGPAALMLGVLYVVFSKLGEEGLIWLVPLLQIGMYHEVMHNILGYDSKSMGTWFILAPFLLRSHGCLQRALGQPLLNLSSFALYAAGLIVGILKLNSQEDLTPPIIQSFLTQSISAIATLVVILSPCQFWIETAQNFG
jgi:hypothetical protein